MHQAKKIIAKQKQRLLAPFLTLLLIFFWGCAAQSPPSGGPKDVTGPVCESHLPVANSTGVETEPKIEIVFSERIEPGSAERSLTITPKPKKPPKIKVVGKKVIVELYEPLVDDVTYIFSFGRNIVDYQKNQTVSEVKLAFSTGDSLDCGVISGHVYDIPKDLKTSIWLYKKKEALPDTILSHDPDYFAVVDANGNFSATNLPRGEYRALAVASKSSGIFRAAESDYFGLPCQDPVLIASRNDTVANINFRLGKHYIQPFRFLSAYSENSILTLTFSQPISESSLGNSVFNLNDTSGIKIIGKWIDENLNNVVKLKLSGLQPDSLYEIFADGIRSQLGEEMQNVDTPLSFKWRSAIDTIGPAVLSTLPRNRQKDVALDALIRINFSEPVLIDSLEKNIHLFTKDSIETFYTYDWQDGNTLMLHPEDSLSSNCGYFVEMTSYSWLDLMENMFVDSLVRFDFQTVNVDTFGSISGKILPAIPTDEYEESRNYTYFYIEGHLTDKDTYSQIAKGDSSGYFVLDQLIEGQYQLSIWEDRDKNGEYDWGKIFPFQIAEPYKKYEELRKVRSRWETAEVEVSY